MESRMNKRPMLQAMNPISSQGQGLSKLRRLYMGNGIPMIRKPTHPEELPEAESIHPGHTLLRPDRNTLKSAAKFPHRGSSGSFVYGNIDNLGIKYGKTSERVMYSDFRKHNTVIDKILEAVSKSKNNGNKKNSLIIIGPLWVKRNRISSNKNLVPLDHRSGEILDGQHTEEDDMDVRRAHHKQHKDKKSLRAEKNCTGVSDSSSSSSSSSDEEDKNPGNPYTIIRSKYKQNYPWNFEMDGDHMNINPYAPEFKDMGPNGAALFYGRKWWYFNQDDYVPMG